MREASPDILAFGLGTPKQEKFFYQNMDQLSVPLALHIGGTIDFEAGVVKRAPRWLRDNGMEWFYRLLQEPRRLFRGYIIDDIQIFRIVWKYRKGNIGV